VNGATRTVDDCPPPVLRLRAATKPRRDAAAINFHLSGTTRIGNHVLRQSLRVPGPVATGAAVVTGLAMAAVAF